MTVKIGVILPTSTPDPTRPVLGDARGRRLRPFHGHDVYDPGHAHSLADPGHAHGIPQQFWVNNAQGAPSNFGPGGWPMYIAAGPSTNPAGTGQGVYGAGTGISLYGNGSGATHNNMPPYQTFIFLIKT